MVANYICDGIVSSVFYIVFMFLCIKFGRKNGMKLIIASNKLHGILPKLSDKLLTFCNTRKEDTVLNRLHIGHSFFTHSFLL